MVYSLRVQYIYTYLLHNNRCKTQGITAGLVWI